MDALAPRLRGILAGDGNETANTRFLAGDVDSFSSRPSFVVHPPLGKWIISLGMMAITPDERLGLADDDGARSAPRPCWC